ncbi:MAG: helix-turn-helix domain-containing protein [Dolichospermum sp. DET50]|nr:helix-turn-helix domain-containing protein [Dolichospermum sp. DET66]MBS3034819.1 helix-turn-helix domain-containing protein [Dolichospermum sp. DET67]MBS3040022.1 helix-turn-helix domain-containing protein [Dolichospermum sp. DET50]QSX67200.1 MAG: helix-turn-helix domain-containing protein [Dolichospermum sp. DET69]
MTGRSLTASIKGIEKAKKALRSNSLNQTALARDLGFSRSTVTNFFRQIPIERLNFEEICTKLGLDWQDIVDVPANETEIEEIENTIFKDPNFLGREEDIASINNLVNEGKKVILIKAEGGIGKTTLAENWFKIQGLDYLKLNVGTTSQNIQSVEDWVRLKLKDYFQIPPVENFMTMLEQFKIKLQNLKIGIPQLLNSVIQDIYPLLPNFIDKHILDVYNNYLEMLSFLKTNVLNDKICNLQFEIVISSLSFEQINNLIENEGFDEIKFIYLDMGNSIISKVTFTLDEFKDLIIGDLSQYQENSNICISGIRSHKSEVKSSKLSESLIFYENRNLQEEWKLTYKDINMLRDYYDANLLITYSLYLTSPEVRSYIEETLLLPIEEIEKHPFKYQE